MFTLEDIEKDASLLLDLKEDVRDECSTLGEVTNVVLYDVRYQELSIHPTHKFAGREGWHYDSQIQGSYQCTGLRGGMSGFQYSESNSTHSRK
jgi:hypothetical protein